MEKLKKDKKFKTIDTEYQKYNGMSYKILRQLNNKECDPICQPMFKVKMENGDIIDAFGDELE